MKLDVFGRFVLEVVRRNDHWLAFYRGNDGKKRSANEFKIPDKLSENEVIDWWRTVSMSTPRHNTATFTSSTINIQGL